MLSKIKAQGSRLKAQGSRLKAQGSRLKDQGSRIKASLRVTAAAVALLGGVPVAQAALNLPGDIEPEASFDWSHGTDSIYGNSDDVNNKWGQVDLLSGGTAAVTGDYPRGADNGSLRFTGPLGTSKGGVAYYPGPNNAGNPGPGFGMLRDLSTASYEWYAPTGQTEAPLMRLLLSNGPYTGNLTTGAPGSHVATLAYIPQREIAPTPIANNAWTAANVLAGTRVVKSSNANGTGTECGGALFVNRPFSDYASDPLLNCRDLYVFAIEIGFGSGYLANFNGAADNVVVEGSFTPAVGPVQRIRLDDQFGVLAMAGGGGAHSVPALGLGGLLGLSTALAGYGALRARRRRVA